MRFILAAGILLWSGTVLGAQVSPTPSMQVDHSGTATGSAVSVLSAGSITGGYRTDCFLQNNGAHTMYYSFTGTATSSSKELAPTYIMKCTNGVNAESGALSLLGTSGDAYSLTESFTSGQQ